VGANIPAAAGLRNSIRWPRPRQLSTFNRNCRYTRLQRKARAAALAIHSPTEDDLVKPLVFDICNQVFEQGGIKSIWTPELLDALHQLPNAHWDEFRGLDGCKDPHKLTRAELYDLLRELDPPIESRSVQKVVGGNGERKSAKGFYRTQFEPHWRALFGGTPAQASKTIRLTQHKESQAGDTD